ncbi:MAG: hypothetical protein A3E87_00730 [Gammaproteobacteria bacterium RIFCSPHIGHO2_12_FULL_35_23]|nr:MAG: hypothetical protein A3E87_00730 [Gammaproteobacteria bacterium RIFCSPHIGHO2_12_FULL_35_23]
MNTCTIELIEKLTSEIEEKREQDLVAYESSHGITVNYKRIFLILRNEAKQVLGVLEAYTAFAEVYIDDIWVDHAYRGKGYGKKLFQFLEKHFQGKGFNNINLVTSAFQAPEFYKKCGFQVEFVRSNIKNPQFTKTFFIKYFTDEKQAQGLLKEQI